MEGDGEIGPHGEQEMTGDDHRNWLMYRDLIMIPSNDTILVFCRKRIPSLSDAER